MAEMQHKFRHGIVHNHNHNSGDHPPDITMREFLESNEPINWSDRGPRPTYKLYKKDFPPLKHIRYLGKAESTLVDEVCCIQSTSRTRVIARKLIDCEEPGKRKLAESEIAALRKLRHPHVVAFVGEYIENEDVASVKYAILLYPPCEWSLDKYMADVWTSGTTHNEAKVYHLRRYFVCLAQGLSYLHATGIRHKDIKPSNILIDKFGNVLIADFGISRRYPDATAAITQTERMRSYPYCSPQQIANEPKGFKADIFSLGAVFAEMATLILGKSVRTFKEYRTTEEGDFAYHQNIGKVCEWLDELNSCAPTCQACSPPSSSPPPLHDDSGNIEEDATIIQHNMVAVIPKILEMLSYSEQERPEATYLWKSFQHISPHVCPDCDPRSATAWPMPVQAVISESSDRHLQPAIPNTRAKPPSTASPPLELETDAIVPASAPRSTSEPVHELSKERVPLEPRRGRRVIVFNVRESRLYLERMAQLEGLTLMALHLPRTESKLTMNIGGELAGTLDLNKLGFRVKIRRFFGGYNTLYVIGISQARMNDMIMSNGRAV